MVRANGYDNKLSSDLRRRINVQRDEIEAGDRGYSEKEDDESSSTDDQKSGLGHRLSFHVPNRFHR